MSLYIFLCCVLVVAAETAQRPSRNDFCQFRPCLNGGTCHNVGSSFVCVCPPGCEGDRCERCPSANPQVGVCQPNPCKMDCVCHESCQHSNGYYCKSASGYLGKNCTTPVPTLRCEPTKIVFSVSESFVKEYDMELRNSYIMITPGLGRPSSCEINIAMNGAYEVEIPMPFTACGTEVTVSGQFTVFKNQAWFNRRLANSMFDMPIPAAEFQCQYQRQYRLVTTLKPAVATPSVITGRRDIIPSISLCKVPTCPGACPQIYSVNGGAVYTVGEMIHVTMSLDSGSQVTGVQNMFLSCDASASATSIVEIVVNGCPTTSGLPCEIRSSFASHTVCVSFQMPRSLPCGTFYIHAELRSCSAGGTMACANKPAVRHCGPARRRRSTEDSTATVFVGPIYFMKNASAGVPSIMLSGMEAENAPSLLGTNKVVIEKLATSIDLNSNEEPAPSQQDLPAADKLPIVLTAAFGCVMLLISLILSFVLFRRTSTK